MLLRSDCLLLSALLALGTLAEPALGAAAQVEIPQPVQHEDGALEPA